MAKWMLAKKVWARLWHEVVCPNVTGGTKERIAQSKRVRAGSLAVVDQPQVVRTFLLRAVVVLSFSGVTSVCFCFVFVYWLYQSRGLQSVLDIRRYFRHDHFITIVISEVGKRGAH